MLHPWQPYLNTKHPTAIDPLPHIHQGLFPRTDSKNLHPPPPPSPKNMGRRGERNFNIIYSSLLSKISSLSFLLTAHDILLRGPDVQVNLCIGSWLHVGSFASSCLYFGHFSDPPTHPTPSWGYISTMSGPSDKGLQPCPFDQAVLWGPPSQPPSLTAQYPPGSEPEAALKRWVCAWLRCVATLRGCVASLSCLATKFGYDA